MTSPDPESPETAPLPDAASLTRLFDGRVVGTETLIAILYEDLRRKASAILGSGQRNQTLQPTALVNEAFVRLADQRADWQNREHFFAVAARCMRRVLIDHARERGSRKRGGDHQRVTLVDQSSGDAVMELDVVDLDEHLQRLGRVSERLVRVVELRFFAGLGLDETARVLGISRNSVARDWVKARTLLASYLEED